MVFKSTHELYDAINQPLHSNIVRTEHNYIFIVITCAQNVYQSNGYQNSKLFFSGKW
jgi:hypothetical protein